MARIYKRGKIWWLDKGRRNGRRYQQSLKTTSKKIAEEALQAYIRRQAVGDEDVLKEATFSEFAEIYMHLRKGQLAESTMERNFNALKKLNPFFGKMSLQTITYEDIEYYKADRMDCDGDKVRQIRPSTVNKELGLLRAMLGMAVELGYLRTHPKVQKFPEDVTEPRFLQTHEAARLISSASGQIRTFIITALNTGLRRGELFALKWEDVRFEQRQIIIAKAKGRRFGALPINDQLFEALTTHPRHKNSEYVFHSPDGTPYTAKRHSEMRLRLWKACDKADLPRIRFHDLRHSFVSNLVIAGIDLRQVQELARHKDIKTTMRYAHLTPGRGMHAVSKLIWESETEDQAESAWDAA